MSDEKYGAVPAVSRSAAVRRLMDRSDWNAAARRWEVESRGGRLRAAVARARRAIAAALDRKAGAAIRW